MLFFSKKMFDIGVNLTNYQFSKDRDDVIARAFYKGVKGLIVIGTNIQESMLAQQLAQRYNNCWSTVGVHPNYSKEWSDDSAEAIYTLVKIPEVIAIGECGLDFYRNVIIPEYQEKVFTAQLQLAAEVEMPVLLHCREAHDRFMVLLEPWLDKLPGAVLHCFTGSRKEALDCINKGLYLGITGWVCDERRGLELRKLLPIIPGNRLLVETDAPYLIPKDLCSSKIAKSGRNEPALLGHILKKVSLCRGQDIDLLDMQTDDNVRRLFCVNF